MVCPRSYSKTLGALGLLRTHKATSPAITREETHEKISKFHHDHEKSAYTSSETHKEILITSPRRRHEDSEVRGSSKPRAESKVGAVGREIASDNGGVFKLCFSNETNHWLFIF